MVVERTIYVEFHSNFGAFKRSRHSKILTGIAVTNGFLFNPTTTLKIVVTNLMILSVSKL